MASEKWTDDCICKLKVIDTHPSLEGMAKLKRRIQRQGDQLMKARAITLRSFFGTSMTRMTNLTTRVFFILALLLGIGGISAWAQDGHHGHEEKEAEEAAVKTEIPKTLPALWAEIVEHQQELHDILAADKLENVHHVAFKIRDYVTALPGKSKLDGDKKKSLKASVALVDTLADELDEAGDGGDSAAVAALIVKLDMELKTVERLYMPKDLKPQTSATDSSKQMYLCPMHPEATSDKPGKCPKCGMALVKKDK